ncbi:anthranilate phosphoribosyltransferase [Leptospira sp. GIMC2001]|uniref:anthranilate phosphoribosyltransferase n=1 Tax=Leptospira sp. GIMC2001 TaxID=1513297 RepID=UPI00234A3A8E|nr:anthranilate phosphoribosyltransferase [Leptospira sp. GIMC2001]WCL48393.1 anthranilate phosphoribosyltransferase [Leptospira sp. GIMC2001]
MQAIDILHKVTTGQNLNRDEARSFLGFVMKGEVSEIVLASFITALKVKGETGEEILGFAQAMRKAAVAPKSAPWDFPVLDTCGTGGDGKGSINVSTLSALTLSSLGVKVAKHGNRSVSSVSGSSDLLSALGLSLELSHSEVEDRFISAGFTFLFAPAWHPAMKFAANVRKELGFRSFFNLIGPLSNPFKPTHQIIGVFSKDWIERVAFALKELGIVAGVVCHSIDGLDEFSIFAPTDYMVIRNNKLIEGHFDPTILKISKPLNPGEVYVSSPEKALELSKNVINGEDTSGAHLVALNAGVALWILDRVESIENGYKMAIQQILNKKVAQFARENLLFN